MGGEGGEGLHPTRLAYLLTKKKEWKSRIPTNYRTLYSMHYKYSTVFSTSFFKNGFYL